MAEELKESSDPHDTSLISHVTTEGAQVSVLTSVCSGGRARKGKSRSAHSLPRRQPAVRLRLPRETAAHPVSGDRQGAGRTGAPSRVRSLEAVVPAGGWLRAAAPQGSEQGVQTHPGFHCPPPGLLQVLPASLAESLTPSPLSWSRPLLSRAGITMATTLVPDGRVSSRTSVPPLKTFQSFSVLTQQAPDSPEGQVRC